MPFIGNSVTTQGFTPAIDYFSGNGVTVTFTLSRPVASVAQLIVAIDNVIQNPSTAFSVSGNSITFTSAPLSGTNNIWVEYTSLITTYAAISQDPSVIGDISATGGYLAEGDFGNTFIDGTIVDYVTGTARITTGPSDAITFYNNGTNARNPLMTLDAIGNVGIGTTSPVRRLEITGSTDINTLVQVNSSLTAAAAIFGVTSGSNTGFVGTITNNDFVFRSNNTERMRIDAAGRITTPFQPAFFSTITGGNYTPGQTFGGSLVSGQPSARTANYSNGVFTAPVAGYYSFNFIVYDFNASATTYALFRNGAGYVVADWFQITATAGQPMTTWSYTIYLNANDYVQMGIRPTGTNVSLYSGHSSWAGFFLG